VALSKPSKLNSAFARFSDVLRKLYVNVPFLEALKEAPSYLKFLRELFSKKGELEEVLAISIGDICSVVLQSKSPSKSREPHSFSIPCSIGDLQIERTLCDLGANMSLMPLSVSLYRKLQL